MRKEIFNERRRLMFRLGFLADGVQQALSKCEEEEIEELTHFDKLYLEDALEFLKQVKEGGEGILFARGLHKAPTPKFKRESIRAYNFAFKVWLANKIQPPRSQDELDSFFQKYSDVIKHALGQTEREKISTVPATKEVKEFFRCISKITLQETSRRIAI